MTNKNTDMPVWEQTGVRALLSSEEIKAINQRSDAPGIVFFLGHLSAMLVSGYLFSLSMGSIWAVLFCFLHGVIIVYWFQPFHECAHKTPFKTAWINSTVYWFSALISLLEPTHFYCEHMQHHRYTQQPDVDPERIPQADNRWGYLFYLTALPYFFYQLNGLFSHFFGCISVFEKAFIPAHKRAQVVFEARVIVAIYIALIVVSCVYQSWFLAVYWLLPRVVGEPFMRMIRLTEHQGCPLVPNLFRNTRSVIAWAPLKYLGWYACYHAEHHLSPNTPFHAVVKLHKKMAGKIEHLENSYLKTHRGIFADLRADRLPYTE